MLYLTRREGEAVIINDTIEVRVVEVRGRTVRLGFSFPPEATVLREEVFEQIRQENEAAARTAGDITDELADLAGRGEGKDAG